MTRDLLDFFVIVAAVYAAYIALSVGLGFVFLGIALRMLYRNFNWRRF
jgi:hypothetical protein